MKRIQRKRVKGWKMPPNTVYVGRPTKWGNPFKVSSITSVEEALYYYESWLRRQIDFNPHFLDPLRGKDLACWCPLNKPCHADVILKMLEVV